VAATLTLCALLAGQTEIPRGPSKIETEVRGEKLELFTYKPESYRDGPLLLVFHGVLRNAEEYRDHARGMGDRFQALVVAPRFAEREFPLERYQFGGVAIRGEVKARETWSGSFVAPIIAEIRKREARPDMPCHCIGHSGGGQFLARMAGFSATGTKQIVVANAGTHLFPSRDLPYPFGFGGLPQELSGDAVLKQYLAQPVTIYVGSADTERDEHFDVTPPAEKQGKTRYERGRNVYLAAQALAKEKGWTCGWKLIEAEGVGHDHEKMFDHARCRTALFGGD
jgi:hypothetical protein